MRIEDIIADLFPVATPTLQQGNPDTQTASRQIQTTTPQETPSFVSQSGKASQIALNEAGKAFGGLITKSIKPAPGYQRMLRIVVQASGGAATTATAIALDAPWNAINSIQMRDPFGTVVYQSDGYGLFLVQEYSAQVGAAGFQNPVNDPEYVAPVVGAAGSGDFTFALYLPFEFDPDTAYGSIPAMNSAAEMNIQIQLGTAGQVYTTAPNTTLPTLAVTIYQEYWIVPLNNPQAAPPDNGSSHQWTQANGQNNITAGGNVRVELPDVGTFISTLICVLRDSLNVRTDDPFSQDLELWIDGVPRFIESPKSRFAEMYRKFGITRPTGVVVYTWRDSIGNLINDDNMEQLLSTTPGTLLELFSGSWGTAGASTPPWNVTTYTGKLYPLGAVPER